MGHMGILLKYTQNHIFSTQGGLGPWGFGAWGFRFFLRGALAV